MMNRFIGYLKKLLDIRSDGTVSDIEGIHKDPEESRYTRNNPRFADYRIGRWTYGAPEILTWSQDKQLTIGRFCSIANEVTIMLGGEHRTDWITTYPFNRLVEEAQSIPGHPASKGDVTIGNDVWIGRNVLILSGVSIGDGAVIGAGSVISRDVGPYAVVAGNPARLIRYRYLPDQIEQLLNIAWWDWPLEKIKEAIPLLLSEDVGLFIARYGSK
jgi:acetyltransferase-like isoleucine patch superfamily enzyme